MDDFHLPVSHHTIIRSRSSVDFPSPETSHNKGKYVSRVSTAICTSNQSSRVKHPSFIKVQPLLPSIIPAHSGDPPRSLRHGQPTCSDGHRFQKTESEH